MDTTKSTRLIALYSPRAQSGKTTTANLLRAGWGYEQIKFAYPLKTMMYSLLFSAGFSQEEAMRYVEGDMKEQYIHAFKSTPRAMMQTLGTEWGRKCVHENIWVNMLERTLEQILADPNRRVVIDDMRYPNELELINRLGGTTIHIDRSTASRDQIPVHSSEGALTHMEFDHRIKNQGTIDELLITLVNTLNLPAEVEVKNGSIPQVSE